MRGLVRALVGACVVTVALVVVAPLVGAAVNPLPVLAACVGVAAAAWFAWDSLERTDPPIWPAAPVPEVLPPRPTDARTRRLLAAVEGAQLGRPVAGDDLSAILRRLVADRLVAHHGADPADPLADARAHLSPDLARHVLAEDPADRPTRVRRPALRAFLKEIDAL